MEGIAPDERNEESETSQRVRVALEETTVPLNITNIDFASALEYLCKIAPQEVNFHVDWHALAEIGVSRKTLVTARLSNVSLAQALDVLLKEAESLALEQINYSISGNIVYISSDPALGRWTQTAERIRKNAHNNPAAVNKLCGGLNISRSSDATHEGAVGAKIGGKGRGGSEANEKSAEQANDQVAGWEDLRDRLERLRNQGEPYTSNHKLAERFGVSSSTVHKAIQNSKKLQAWQAEAKQAGRPRKATDLGPVVLHNKAQRTEPDPAEQVDREAELARLISEQKADHEPSPLDKGSGAPQQHKRA
jgi:hypothetical protein